ncbi:microtubule-associated protein futsch isoform X2 [Solenopsis invicta]|uniref:microtubule-associated protein futsch isoform X2 n=1 Tax=Solenopsis invicta TaxID=13686 RepID=UPI00193DF62C|nr:microtubule-associated protein futsch isoform X2 [Solenopsis invicta]
MSTTDPTGEGGGGGGGGGGEGGGEGATTTNVEQTASPSTPITGTAVPVQATAQQQQPPQQHPPPSPLSGCYLLVVLPEPHTAQHKDLILNRLAKGFLSWDKDSCHVDLEKELLALVAQAPEGEEARNGERLIQYATENLVTEVLIHPQTNTLLQCIRNLLASFTKHRHIIHAGYTFGGNGSWILQDGTFSLADFLDAFSEHEVQRVLRAYENSVTVDIHCAGVGDWTTSRLSKEACCRYCRVRVNPDDVLTAGVPAITSFTNYIGQYLVPQTLDQLMEPSDVVGNIRFSHPTLYVFPGGQGDAALFGINGFNMLVDGGFARKACFWDFTRHLDRLDAVLVTRINNSNIGGMFSVLRKKKEMHVYPQIGHFFCNLVERRQSNSPDGDKDIDPLVLNLTDIGQEMVVNLRHINLRAHPCYRDPNPINLYHKVGHGTLDMYVLSPSKDSREVREFLAKWHASDSKMFAGSHKKDSNNLTFPIQNLVSICALLVWQPANPEDNITRILFPGSTPQHKIFAGFERLKHLDFLKHPVCSAKSLSPSVSLATLRDKPAKQKLSLIEKEPKKILESKREKREPSEPKSIKTAEESAPKSTPQPTPIIPTSKPKTEIKTKKVVENKKIETEAKESKKIEKELKEVKKEPKKEPVKAEKREDDVKKTDLIKPEPEKTKELKESKESKPKPESKKKEPKESKVKVELKKSEVTPKPKLSEKRVKPSGSEKRDSVKSSPTTPKKTLNGAATKTEISKAVLKPKPAAKIAPSLPAKSAKEANNRKVVEQKKSEVEKSTVKDTAAPVTKASAKPKPIDRKPISRRAKPVSPNKIRTSSSPAKSTRSTPTASVKSDKDGVIRKVKGDKGTTDSSTVSTPSGIEPEAIKPIDKSLVEQSEDISLDSIESKVLADLKEEREVVEEIEAVLQKAERVVETQKEERFEGDDEITAEATDKKEEDVTEEDVTAEIEDVPKKESSRKESQELTEEDEYLIVEKEEVYTEDSAQSGEGEQKHVLDEAQSEKAKVLKDVEAMKEKGEKEEPEEKGKDDSPEKKVEKTEDKGKKEIVELSSEHKEQLQEEVKEIIASAAEIVQKTEEKDDSGKKDSEDLTKEPSSLSPDKLDSSEKKTTDTDVKPDADQKENILEKMEESQERISTIESGATTTAPTLPEDERIPLDEIKEDIDEKHVIEEVKEKDVSMKKEESFVPETVPETVKPEVKVFDVRQVMQNLQRDIVKTPDEVADLPVHEEVDPKLYKMEDFEKGKEEKPSPTAPEGKESPTSKEQKGVFSFFGKVADKFEKGIDKLTKKTKKDSEKDSDEKSSSKSSSPKEPKEPVKMLLEEVDVEKMFPKIGKSVDKPETFEEIKPTIADVKVATIKETAAFIQEEIVDAQRQSVPDIEEKISTDKLDEVKKVEAQTEELFLAKDVLPAADLSTKPTEDKDIAKEIELLKEEDIGEDVEEVKALLEEASKKFKTVKDSLRDSLESLEDKIKEEIVDVHEIPSMLKDAVEDTLAGVAEKLEEMKPHIDSHLTDIKEPEKVKFDIPKDEEFEEEYEEEIEGPYKDMKEAVKDIGEVLAGSAGIELEEKPKDVIEIVKKVAEVLREDDFFSDKTLFDQDSKKGEISPISTDRKPSKEEISPKMQEDVVIPDKVDIAEIAMPGFSSKGLEEPVEKLSSLPLEKPGALEIKEEPCVKIVKEKDDIMSPVKDVIKDMRDAQKICAEMLKEDQHICDQHKKPEHDDTCRVDVMKAGIECVCVKKEVKRASSEEKLDEEVEESVIGFEQKISPAKAEIVMVTPGSTPTSPKFVTDKMYEGLEIGLQKPSKLPEDIKQVLDREAPVEEVIEEFIITKKKKVTVEVIEYITVVKRIPRERVIYIIEEIIIKKGLPKESVVDDPEILKLKESITPEKRLEIEEYITNEYIVKGKRITIEVIEEISIKKIVPKKILIEIIEEIIVKRKIARHMILDVPEDVLLETVKEELPEESLEQSAEEQITPKIDITAKRESVAKVSAAPTGEKEESITEASGMEIPETEELITSQKRAEVEEYIINEYVTKGDNINIKKLEEICGKKKVPKRTIIEIIEEIIIKRKIPRHAVLAVTEEELSRIIEEEAIPESQTLVEKKESVSEEKKTLIKLEEDKKEDVLKREMSSDEELSPMSEEEDVEKEVDGFVSVPRRISDTADAKKKAIPDVSPTVAKEHEKDVIDDFEAVEQEYKVRDVPITSPEKADEMKEKEDVEEALEDTTSEVIEADEKFVQETKGKVGKEELPKDIKPADKKGREESEISEIVDTTEKYLDEAKEKTDDILLKDTTAKLMPSVSDKAEKTFIDELSKEIFKEKAEEPQFETKDDKAKPTSPIKDEILKDIVHSIEQVPEKITEDVKPETKLTDATGFAQEPKVELLEDDKKSKLSETMESKETLVIEEEKSPQIDDGIVKRMLVTACSEDGREVIEICPTGSITFTKTVTPDDSLKDISAKSTPDKDSLILDKDSHSGVSTPEKDSISEKSAPKGKDKISPDDSLEKSPAGPRDSQDLEDSLEKSESRKPPEQLEDITKPKSPAKDTGEIEEKIEKSRTPSPLEIKHEDVQKPESPLDMKKSPIESAEKPKLPIEKVLPESKKEGTIGFPKTPESLHSEDVSPAETIFSKSPTDKSEMYFAKAPITEEDVEKSKQDIISLDKSSSVLSGKIDEKETDKPQSPSIIEKETISEKLPIFESEHDDEKGPIDEARSPSAISDKSDERKEAERSKSPSIVADKPDLQDVMERYLEKPKSPIFDRPDSPKAIDKTEEHDKDRSPSIASDKSDSKKVSDRSRSPSISVEKIDFKDTDLSIERTRSPSVKDDKLEQFPVAKSIDDKTEISKDALKSPKLEHKSDLKDIMQLPDKSRSSSVTSEPKEPDRSKSPSIAGEKPDMKDVLETSREKSRSPSVSSVTSEHKEPIDRSKSPSIAGEKIDLKDVAEPTDRSKSPSVMEEKPDLKEVTADKSRSSITGEQKELPDRSKSPSVVGEKIDLKDVAEPTDRSKSPSVMEEKPDLKEVTADKSRSSITGEQKELPDRSKSPSVVGEKIDLKDVAEPTDRSKSPSIMEEEPDLKEVTADKSRSSSITEEQKELPDRSKSPSIAGEKIDLKDVAEPTDRSKSPSVMEEKPDLKEVTADKSRSSITGEQKELPDRSKSPSVVGEKIDLKDVAEPIDRSKSPSVMEEKPDLKEVTADKSKSSSITEEQKELPDRSKSPSIAGEKIDLKDVAEPTDRSKSSSVMEEKPDLKEVTADKSRSSITGEQKELPDRSKSPSIAGEKIDLKDVAEPTDRSKSPGVMEEKPDLKEVTADKSKSSSITGEQKELPDRSKSPSIVEEKIDLKDVAEPTDRSKSPSVMEKKPDLKEVTADKSRSSSITEEQKELPDHSKSPSIVGEKIDLKDVAEPTDRSKSPSVTGEKSDLKEITADKSRSSSITGEQKELPDRSKSPSIVGEKIDLKDVAEPTDRSKSPSVTGEKPDLKEVTADKSRSSSIIGEQKELPDRSKSPSIVGEKIDLKDVAEPTDRSKSPSVMEEKPDLKEVTADKSRSSSIIGEQKELPDRSKSPSVVGEKIDLKDVAEPTDRSKSPSVTGEKPDLKEVTADKFRSSSITGEQKELSDHSKSPSIVGEKPDMKDVTEQPDEKLKSPTVMSAMSDLQGFEDRSKSPSSTDLTDITERSSLEKSKSPSIASITSDQKEPVDKAKSPTLLDKKEEPDRSKSPSMASEKSDGKKSADGSRATSVTEEKPDLKDVIEPPADKSRSSSVASEKADLFGKSTSPTVSDKLEPPVDRSKSPSSTDDKSPSLDDMKITHDKPISSSIVLDKPDDKQPIEKIDIEGKLLEKQLPQEEKYAFVSHFDIEKPLDEKDECKEDSKSPISSSETIEKKMQKIREKRFADFKEPDIGQSSKIEKSDDEDEDIVKVTVEKKAEIEKYILNEFITKKRKISLTVIERLVMMYSVPQFIVMEIIEDIISRQNMPKGAVFDFVDDEVSFKPQSEKGPEAKLLTSQERAEDFGRIGITPEYIQGHEKPGDTMRGESPDGKISPVGSDRYGRDLKAALSVSPSLSPELIPSDKSTQDSPARSEPHIDEEILISEQKRMEIEKLLEEEYIKKGKKITEVILEEIIVKTSLPRYIILEIVEEIVLKKKIPRESVIDVEIYHEEEPEEDYDKAMYRYEAAADVDYELPHDARKSSVEYRMGMYPESSERQMDKSDYPTEYESQFHKAFVGGMTEMRTTHITTLSGKSTPEFTHDAKAMQPTQTVTILRESKIAETIDKDEFDKTAGISATVSDDHAVEPQEIAKEVKRPSIQQDEPEAITKREIVEHDEPEVITKVITREIIEQDKPEIITKVIRREIIVPDEETGDSKEDSGECTKTITTRTTRTIVTEELPEAELAQTDPSKIYTDLTSSTSYRTVSDKDAPDTTSVDVKQIVTTVTTVTGPDSKVTTQKDVKESVDTLASKELLEKLTETASPAEQIIKETITTVTSGITTPDVKAFYDSGKSTPDLKEETKLESTEKECLDADKFEHPVSPLIRDLISEDKSYSGKSSPDISLPKDIVFSGKSTPEIPMSPLIRDGAVVQPHVSGRSTPDKRSEGRSSTSTPEGFRSVEMLRTIVTTTKTVSDEGEIVTTTREVTETTNEKGETVVLTEKTDVKVDERLPSKNAAESAISSIIGSIKSSELQRTGSPGPDDIISEKDPVDPSSEHSSVHSKTTTQLWGSSEERHYSDDEPPSSPFSLTSQVEYSPQATRHYESASDTQEEEKVEFSAVAMSSSFYGELPAVPPQISAMKTFHGETGMQKDSDPVHSRFTVEKEPVGEYGEKSDAKRYVDEADLDFEKALMDRKDMKEAGGAFSSGISPIYTNGSLRHEATDEKDHPSSSFQDDTKDDSKKDPLEGWGTPLGLPSPKPPRKFNLKNSAQSPSCSSETTSDTLNFDVIKNWGEPLRLPSPAPVTNEVSNKGTPSTPKKERKQTKKVQSENIKNKKRSESPGKNEKKVKDSKNKFQPVYMDLAYVPHHGNSYYTSLEFFKRVRARYYVFSGTEPSREVYDALLEAKKTWEDKNLEVTMIPTYDTDTLGYWVADNEEALAANHIDLSPSASRCTINLQDHETSCSAYRLEF